MNAPARPGSALTARELEALRWVANGLTTEATARRMGIQAVTVRERLEGASRRLGTVGRTQTVAVAMRLGLIRLEQIEVPEGLRAPQSRTGTFGTGRSDRSGPEKASARPPDDLTASTRPRVATRL